MSNVMNMNTKEENIALWCLGVIDDETLLEQFIVSNEVNDIEEGDGGRRSRIDYSRSKKRKKIENPWENIYYLKLIKTEAVKDPRTREGKEFRADFRVPFPIFNDVIVPKCRATKEKCFNYEKNAIAGVIAIPLELKILFVLRVLGSGLFIKDGVQLTTERYMSTNAGNTFFRQFIKLFVKHFKDEYIKEEMDNETLRRTLKEYSMLGLPGCVGSIDAVFIKWNKVPYDLSNLADGDKGKGVLFEVVVNHSKLVLATQSSVFGTINDKISIKYSNFMNKLKDQEIYNNVTYKVRTGVRDEDFIELKNCYVIADGGYTPWYCILCGFGPVSERHKYKFNEWIASVRKDVECFFGILKQRFRYLQKPIELLQKEDVDNVFITCCILHNMILKADGLDKLWENGVNWKRLNPRKKKARDYEQDVDEDTGDEESEEELYVPIINAKGVDNDALDVTDILPPPKNYFAIYDDEKRKHEFNKELIANHLHYQYVRNELRWPKYRKEIDKTANETIRNEYFPGAGDIMSL